MSVYGIPEVYLTFAISATGPNAAQTFPKMKEYITAIINRYDPKKFKYSVIVFGLNAKTGIKFSPDLTKKDLITTLNGLSVEAGGPSLVKSLTFTDQFFKDPIFSQDIQKAVILMWDKNSTENAADITTAAKTLTNKNIRVIPVPMIPDPVSAADAANPSKERVIVPNTVASDSANIGEQIVDIVLSGERVQVTRVGFGGDKQQQNAPSQLRLYFSVDNSNYSCFQDNSACRNYYSTKKPPIPGTFESFVEVNKGAAVDTRYIRYDPREPDPAVKAGGSSLRIEAYGCIEVYPEMDVLFALSATSANKAATFTQMKNTVKDIVNNYGIRRIRYAVTVFGAAIKTPLDFTMKLTKDQILSKIDGAAPENGPVNIQSGLTTAKTIFDNANPKRPNAKKVLVVMNDQSTNEIKSNVDTPVKQLTDNDVQLVGVGVGTNIKREQLEWITRNTFYVIHVSRSEQPRHLGSSIMTRAIKGIDITFVVSATSSKANVFYKLIKDTLKEIVNKYGMTTIHYSVIIYGSKSSNPSSKTIHTYTQSAKFPNKAAFANELEKLEKTGGRSSPYALDDALQKAEESFNDPKVRPNADHIVVIITDNDSSQQLSTLKPRVDSMENKGIRIIPVGIEKNVKPKELRSLTSNDYDVIIVYDGVTKDTLQSRIMKKVYRLDMPDIDLTFIINAASTNSDATYTYIQTILRSIIQRYNYGRIYYSFTFYGSVPTTKYDFGQKFPNKEVLLRAVSKLPKNGAGTKLDKALEEVKRIYETNNVRSNSWKIAVLLFDKRSGVPENTVKNAAAPLREIGVRVIPVGIGSGVSYREMEIITAFEDNILTVPRDKNPVETGEEIMKRFLRLPLVDVVFVINADSANKTTVFKKMQDAIKQIGDKFGVDRFHYSVVVYGTTLKKEFAFNDPIPYEEELKKKVDATNIISGFNNLPNALKEAKNILDNNAKVRPTSRKAIVVISDKSSGQTVSTLKTTIRPIHDQGRIVVASSVGGDPKREELRAMTTRKDDVIEVSNSDTSGYLGDRIVARILKDGIPEIDITFAITASVAKPNVTKLMKDIIKSIIYRYGDDRIRVSVIVFGNKPIRVFDFGFDFPDEKALLDRIGSLPTEDTANPDLQKSLEDTRKLFEEAPVRPYARRVLVTIIDRSSKVADDTLKKSTKDLQDIGVIQIPVVIGSNVPNSQIESITIYKDNVIKTSADTPSWEIGEEIITKIIGLPEMYIVFAITTEAALKDSTYKIMTDTVKNMGDKFGIRKFHFSIITFGKDPKTLFDFDTMIPDQPTLIKEVNKVPKASDNPINFDSTMKKVEQVFDKTTVKPNSKKVLVVITHKTFGVNATVIHNALKPLDEKRIIAVVVAVGDGTNEKELENIARTDRKIIKPSGDDSGRQVVDEIIKSIIGGIYD
ncbi:hypothetical protein QZH41_018026 [Actinostola sp. cb2023]|nr:hypothetical protein QZH41_018026 [Actinostola sp. cb2023]